MSRTRLAAAAGVAALTLGATAAVAETERTQEVTIVVNAAPRTITGPSDVTITTTVGTDINANPVQVTLQSVTYTNPSSQTPARVVVTSEGDELEDDSAAGELTLTLEVTNAGDIDGNAGTAVSIAKDDDTGSLVTGIPAGTTSEQAQFSITLSSATDAALADAVNITRTVTYTITDNE
jgi:hypothetical protein